MSIPHDTAPVNTPGSSTGRYAVLNDTAGSLRVLDAGFLTTVQDQGRPLGEPLGAPAGGAMDRLALMAANALVGNPPGAAALEFALLGPTLRVEAASGPGSSGCGVLLAAAGRGFRLDINGHLIPLWMAAWVRCGETVTLRGGTSRGKQRDAPGGWGYLAVSGGIAVPEVLGSRSTCLRANFGGFQGRPLQPGDTLPIGNFPAGRYELAGRELHAELHPAYSDHPVLDVVLGPQQDAFTPGALHDFLNEEYALTPACDRMGYRMSGPALERLHPGELLSEGVALGAVQVPPDGQPIVLMADRQTTGGYPKIAVVSSASLPLLAQCPAGSGTVRFRSVSVSEAQAQWRAIVRGLGDLE
jgi:antagonist of KipI